jgi:hypothetical protein
VHIIVCSSFCWEKKNRKILLSFVAGRACKVCRGENLLF